MITLIKGNCIEEMKKMPDKSVDLVLTDPPYGVGLKYASYEDNQQNWYMLMQSFIPNALRISKMLIMPCCRIANLSWIYKNYAPDWLICWYKGSPGHRSYIGFNDWEPHLVYGKTHTRLCMHDYFQTRASPKKGTLGHPCPKPIEWANWILERSTLEGMTVLDAFMGSGTTGVACKKLKRNFIGIELDDGYFKIAKERIDATPEPTVTFKEI